MRLLRPGAPERKTEEGRIGMSLAGLAVESRRYWDNCKKDSDALQAQSLRLFRRAAKRAWRTSPFYRSWYASLGITADVLDTIEPSALPVLTKAQVRANFRGIAAVPLTDGPDGQPLPRRGAVLAHTSGSTGKPCAFLYAPQLLTRAEANFVRLSNYGGDHFVGWGDLPIRSLHVASVGRGYASSLLLTSGLRKYHAESVVLDTAVPMESWRATLGGFQPNFLSGYPSCIALLAGLQEAGQICLHPKKVICGGEPLSPEQMARFQALFGADVINYYGCTEALLLGAGASWYEGLYLFDDLNYTETDEAGRLIVTPLYNPAFPLIRYRMNDILEGFSRGRNGAPLPFTHIDRVVGREEDLLWFTGPAGKRDFLHPLLLDDLDADGLLQYQFVQQDDTHFLLRCVAVPGQRAAVAAAVQAQLDTMLRRKGLENVRWQLVFADRLAADPAAGKVPLVCRAAGAPASPV